jgi:hypothetical protein
MDHKWKSTTLDADVLYGPCETKPTIEELELYIIDLGPFRHIAGRNKILLLLLLTVTSGTQAISKRSLVSLELGHVFVGLLEQMA